MSTICNKKIQKDPFSLPARKTSKIAKESPKCTVSISEYNLESRTDPCNI